MAELQLLPDLIVENHHLNDLEYQQNKTRLDSFPYYIQIGADNRCNMKCGFCLAEAYRERGLVHIQDRRLERNPLELFQRLRPYMRYWEYLSLTGPGESLLNPKLGEIIVLVRENSSCKISITTNGVLINPRLSKLFLDYRVDEISISLDSLKKRVFEELRVNGKFEKAMQAIQFLNREKERRGSELPHLNLVPTFMRKNIRELPAFVSFAARHQIHSVQASPLQVYRRTWVKESLLSYPDLTRRMVRKAEARARDLGVRLINNLKMVYVNRGRRLTGWLKEEETVDFPTDPSACLKPWNSVFIEPDGEVRPCCYQSPVYGNLYEEDFPSIWNGLYARSLRKAMLDKELPRACRQCYEFNRHDPTIMIQVDFPA